MQYPRHLRALREPLGHGEPLAVRPRAGADQACAGRAAPKTRPRGPRHMAKASECRAQTAWPRRALAEVRPSKQVGMAGEIFCPGLDGHVDAGRVRADKNSGVAQVLSMIEQQVSLLSQSDQGRQIRDLEALRTRCLEEKNARIGPDQVRDGTGLQGIVIGGLDTETLQDGVAEIPRRPVDRIRDQNMVARFNGGQKGDRDRGEPGGRQHGVFGSGTAPTRLVSSERSVVGVPCVP